jgi:hypothetical protein
VADSPPGDPDAEPTEAERAAWRERIEAEEAAFFAGLKDRTGRTWIEWCDWLDAAALPCTHKRMLELLQREGFQFRWASVLERLWSSRRRHHTPPPTAPDGGLPPQPEAPAASAPPPEPAAPAPADSPAAGAADAAGEEPAVRRSYPHSAREHAAALIAHVARVDAERRAHGAHHVGLPADIFWKDLAALHCAMCARLGWPERPWNPVAAELAQLIGEPKPHYPRVDGAPRGRRWRYYERDRILAAAPPARPAAPLALPAPLPVPAWRAAA